MHLSPIKSFYSPLIKPYGGLILIQSMVLIISSPDDLSTDFVIDWLRYYKYDFYRLNFTDLLNLENRTNIEYSVNTNQLTINERSINLSDVTAVWSRKIGKYNDVDFFIKGRELNLNPELMKYLLSEYSTFLSSVLQNISEDAYWITDFKVRNLQKWDILRKAISAGLMVPETYVVNSKPNLENLTSKYNLITKPLRDPIFFLHESSSYSMYTKEINNCDLELYPNWFFPSIVQNRIEKDFEIRCFFLEDKFFSMAIISQADSKTILDYREYNLVKFNRNVSFNLPKEIEDKLRVLALKLGLNCGSFDIIKDKNGNYIFLEVNPNGQFGMVDIPCNYNLNKLLAETLIKKSNERRKEPVPA